MGIAPNGRQMTNVVIVILRISEGMIAEEWGMGTLGARRRRQHLEQEIRERVEQDEPPRTPLSQRYMFTASEGTDNPPWCGSGRSAKLLNPPGNKPNTRVRKADLISHRNGDVQVAPVHVRPAIDHRDVVRTPS